MSTNPGAPRATEERRVASEYSTRKYAEYEAVMRGEAALEPPCFTCKRPSTHVSETVTPGGCHAWQCDRHARSENAVWGGDPGWPTVYIPIPEAAAIWEDAQP